MSKNQLAIIVNKTCDICMFVDVQEGTETLLCVKYDSKVDDKFLCNEFELCKEVMSDTFFDIQRVQEYEEQI